jgi:lipoprotein-releasing system permease protein
MDVVTITIVSFVLALAATIYPSWRAARVQPAEALRYE